MGQRLFQMFAHFIFIAILGGTQFFSSFNPRKDSEARSTGVEAQQSPRLLGRQLLPLSAMGLHFSVSGQPILTIWNFGEESPGPVFIGVDVGHGPAQAADRDAVCDESHRLPWFTHREGARSQIISASVHFGKRLP